MIFAERVSLAPWAPTTVIWTVTVSGPEPDSSRSAAFESFSVIV